ncbi:MAG: hypothetical protein QOE96_827 [Blastocatellia bacterium]|jgi:hypothetical protein|nr:hypothetical protein [Blastocatellia bacterium]
MKNSRKNRHLNRLLVVCVAILAVAALVAARPLSGSVTIVNNSNREIRNVYFSHVNADDWGADQLAESHIAAGQSHTISNVTWDQQQLKVIGEDQDGCFLSTVVASGTDSTWTITNDTVADCGSN